MLGPGRKLVYYPPEIDEKSTGSETDSVTDPTFSSTDVFRFEMSFIFPKYQQHVDMLYFESRQRDVEWNMNVKVGDNITLSFYGITTADSETYETVMTLPGKDFQRQMDTIHQLDWLRNITKTSLGNIRLLKSYKVLFQ